MRQDPKADETETLDPGDFGKCTPHYSNRFHMFVNPSISRIYFGDQLSNDGDVLFHTSIVMQTSNLVELRDLINQLLSQDPHGDNEEQ